jgi:hypothetical protein
MNWVYIFQCLDQFQDYNDDLQLENMEDFVSDIKSTLRQEFSDLFAIEGEFPPQDDSETAILNQQPASLRYLQIATHTKKDKSV